MHNACYVYECYYYFCSPFAAERDETSEGSESAELCKPKTLKGSVGGGAVGRAERDSSEEGLTSLVHTTLHGDCRPVMEYGLVGVVWI